MYNMKAVNETNCTANWTRTAPVSFQHSLLVVQIFLGAISVFSILGNGLVCVVVLRNREILSGSVYNMFLFSLALSDMVTGFSILATPTLVIDGNSFPVLSGGAGELFCRLVYSQYFVFALSKVSVFTVAAMSLERWYSILRPLQYKLNFKKKCIYVYLGLIWLLGFGCVAFIPFGRVFNSLTSQCTWSWAPFHRELLITLFPLLTFFAPSVIACLTLLHIYVVIRKSRLRAAGTRNVRTKRKLLRLCSIVVIMLTLCWLPNQLYYVLSAYDITTLETPLHYFTTVLAMSNSSLNPCVYCFANRKIRRGVLLLFRPVEKLFRKRNDTSQEHCRKNCGVNSICAIKMHNCNEGIMLSFRNITSVDETV